MLASDSIGRGARLVQAGNVRERMYQRPVAYQVKHRSRIPFGFVGIVENGIVFPGKRLVLRRALRDGVRPGSAARAASTSSSSMHLMATLRWMRVSHATRTVPKPPAFASPMGRYRFNMSCRSRAMRLL